MDLRTRAQSHTSSYAAPAKPFVTAATEGRARTVVAVNAAAAARGIVRGMALARARVIAPTVEVEPARPEAEARALTRLTLQMLRYSPLVAPAPPDGLWIDATGAAHLFGGEESMVEKIVRRLKGEGFAARAALAATPGAAWAWARYGAGGVLADSAALSALPLAALRLPEETVAVLRRLGLKCIADLKGIPRATLPGRFGREVLLRLDQAFGRASEPLDPMLPPRARRQRLAFAEPIATPEDLARTIDRLTADLCADLDKTQDGARQFDLVFACVDGSIQPLRLRCAHPTRDTAHIAKLLTAKLENVDPGFGIEAATLTALRLAPLTPRQIDTDGTVVSESDLGALVDRLSSRVGARNVFRIKGIASDLPERAAVPASPMRTSQNQWPAQWPRPVRLLSPPEPVQVIALLPDYPPATFRWRDRSHSVRIADGPERMFGEWWQDPREVGEQRDYFRVETDKGERYWLFRTSRPGANALWFMHGVFA